MEFYSGRHSKPSHSFDLAEPTGVDFSDRIFPTHPEISKGPNVLAFSRRVKPGRSATPC